MSEQTSSTFDAPEWNLEQRGQLRLVGTTVNIQYNLQAKKRMELFQSAKLVASFDNLPEAKIAGEQLAIDLRELGFKP